MPVSSLCVSYRAFIEFFSLIPAAAGAQKQEAALTRALRPKNSAHHKATERVPC
jgi:hypothetical protein